MRNTWKNKLILLMAKILHQLVGSVSHYLQGLYILGGAGFLPSTVSLSLIHHVSGNALYSTGKIPPGSCFALLFELHPYIVSIIT